MPGRIARTLATGTDPGDPEMQSQRDIAIEHIETMFSHYGGTLGIKNARKHIGWYLKSSGVAEPVMKSWRARLCTEWQPAAILSGLSEFYESVAA
jgi:tRNA-dihydrouridine synthase B